MKLATLSTLLLLANAAPALADVADSHPPVAVASIEDQNLDSLGDVTTIGGTTVQLGPGGEERTVLEFDITSTLLPNFTGVSFLIRLQAADALPLGSRQFNFVLYPADGVASTADFHASGMLVGSVSFDPAVDPDPWLTIDVTAEITAMMQANITHAGLRVQAASNPSGMNAVNLIGTELFFEECFPQFSIPYCFGDGTGAACPCGNTGAAQAGCATGSSTGATLFALGVPQIPPSNPYQLVANGVPPNRPGLFFGGTMSVSVPVGDGLLCAAGSSQRFEIVFSDQSGSATTSVDIPTATGVQPGDQRYYQYWFRDTSGPCGGGFNFTHGLQVTWF